MKRLYLFFYVFLILFITSCSSHVTKKQVDKNIVQKIVLCDVQKEVFPEIEKALLNLLHISGYPDVKFLKKVDFEDLYNKKFN